MSAPVVTQADRDAAADYLCSIGQHGSARQCRDGRGWRTTAEAFAAHRTAAEAASAATVAELVDGIVRDLALTKLANFEGASAEWLDGFGFAMERVMQRAKATEQVQP